MFRRNGDVLTKRRMRHSGLRTALLASSALLAAALPVRAQDANWSPGSGNFNNPSNWDTGLVPTGTAFFGTASKTDLFFSANTLIGGWTFNAGADDYTFTNNRKLMFDGAGIVINGGSATITNKDTLRLGNSSSAGNATITNKGLLVFTDNSNAGTAAITNKDTGTLRFRDTSSAGNATIKNNGLMVFRNDSTAGDAVITNKFFGFLSFHNSSSAGNAAIENNGIMEFRRHSSAGTSNITNNFLLGFLGASSAGNATITTNLQTQFFDNSTGGNARFITNAGGLVDFSNSTWPNGDGKITAGSIEGAGDYIIGSGNTLIVGSNNLSTEVSGVIADSCGCFVGSGSLVKVGLGTLILSATNLYTGTTESMAAPSS
jgi:autotransporter-associated beta strand protein